MVSKQRMAPLARALLVLAALVVLVPLSGCQQRRSTPARTDFSLAAGAYADGPEGLQRLWSDILAACQKDQRERVHDLMASLALTQEELAGLIGAERGAALWPRYQSLIGPTVNQGAVELVAMVYEKKFNEVVILPADAQRDAAVLAALTRPTPVYTVRIRKKGEPSGLRYDFFVYLGGRWRTGGQLGQYLGKPR